MKYLLRFFWTSHCVKNHITTRAATATKATIAKSYRLMSEAIELFKTLSEGMNVEEMVERWRGCKFRRNINLRHSHIGEKQEIR